MAAYEILKDGVHYCSFCSERLADLFLVEARYSCPEAQWEVVYHPELA